MGVELSWRTRRGARTLDNRDCAAVGIRPGEILCILLDGSTEGRDSGELARSIARCLIDAYVASGDDVDSEDVIAWLRELHTVLVPDYPGASASYMLALVREQDASVFLHVGDCLVGRVRGGRVEWLCQPHTLANPLEDLPVGAIATAPARHWLTRSFRAREFMPPEVIRIAKERELIMATDGFWADLTPEAQCHFLEGAEPPEAGVGDDCSVLRIRTTSTLHGVVFDPAPPDTLYVRTQEAPK